ncbi:hybrid sensor histidine kinase/response regulator [candidate division KSB3 bacterium]|uniref:histidine kinase n=1 Tax=candidate division KSB3 bacterium TaxID=2044937 RepID=A0A2G6KLG1_9BACT|nr:MAG: hybrid sensor histidine kinase/response regulator [candidate division KSB3 bacterium]
MSRDTILIVDDNLTNLQVLLNFLHDSGFETLVAQNGEGALRQVKYAQPDIILLDVMMPGLNGFDTCRLLKERPDTRDTPIIFMTALSEVIDKVEGFESGGVDYITKPFEHEDVLARLNVHLTIRRLQRELEEKNTLLEHKNAQLLELNASKDKFFSIIAHDLKAPFSALLGLTRAVTEDGIRFSEDEIYNVMQALQTSTENLYALLENLLAWSRIQSGMIDYRPWHMRLYEVIHENIDLFHLNAEQKQISFENDVSQKTMVYADKDMIDTIVRNLISNALKFTHFGGTIRISAREEGQYIEIAVSDTGIGMSEDEVAKLFRIDVKYRNYGTDGEDGTGLGLILCKELVEKNNGTIWVESEPGHGSTFRFTLLKE